MLPGVTIAVSTVDDGPMRDPALPPEVTDRNRRQFFAAHESAYDEGILVWTSYDRDDFCQYRTVDAKNRGENIQYDGQPTDGLVTTTKRLALFLPLADCVGAVLYDAETGVLMLSHLGRHSLEQHGGKKSVEFLVREHAVDPAHIQVWLSPSAGSAHYPLFAFNNKGLQDVAVEQFNAAGVTPSNIQRSTIDTTTDHQYFSHSEFVQGNRASDGRFGVLAMLT